MLLNQLQQGMLSTRPHHQAIPVEKFLNSIFTRPAFAPIYANQYSHSTTSAAQSSPLPWAGNHTFLTQQYHSVTAGANIKREADMASSCSGRKEKRQYKKRKHKTTQRDKPYPSPGNIFVYPSSLECTTYRTVFYSLYVGPVVEPASSDEDEPLAPNHLGHENVEDEGSFVFKRLKPCTYQKVCLLAADRPYENRVILTVKFCPVSASHKRIRKLAMDIEIGQRYGRSEVPIHVDIIGTVGFSAI